MSRPRIVSSDRPITCAEVAENGCRIKAERKRVDRKDRLMRAVIAAATWIARRAR